MKIIPNFGILASISWNSNKWQDDPTDKDLKASKYDFVIENAHMHESLNFGHEIYPAEEDGSFVLTRQCSIGCLRLKNQKI
ncbi:MAG: hypothetical protein KIS77_13275 [Saprospiraceae bacterium]|nr:hypothetical protein [Saprospiraceae bacterium]